MSVIAFIPARKGSRSIPSKNIKLLQSNPYSISSICEARQKLPEDIFLEINSKIVKVFNNQRKKLLMNKHRVYAIDGTKVSLDKNLEAKGYKIVVVTKDGR